MTLLSAGYLSPKLTGSGQISHVLAAWPLCLLRDPLQPVDAEKKGAIFLREMEVIIDTEEIAEFFFQELLKRGYAPVVEELEEIADITFDYLLMKCIIDEELED